MQDVPVEKPTIEFYAVRRPGWITEVADAEQKTACP